MEGAGAEGRISGLGVVHREVVVRGGAEVGGPGAGQKIEALVPLSRNGLHYEAAAASSNPVNEKNVGPQT